jgi:hypothetical protein
MAAMKLALVVAAAAVWAGTAAASSPPRPEHTSEGTKLAQASLLRIGDLGTGWTSTAVTGRQTGLNLSCAGFAPRENDLVEIGTATSPIFKGTAIGPFLLQTTSVYQSAKDATTLWQRTVKPRLAGCLALPLETTKSVGVTITSQTTIPIGRIGDRSIAYRFAANLSSGKSLHRAYYDVLLIAGGQSITQLTVSEFQRPPPLNWEIALAKVAAGRLGSGGPPA